MYSVALHNQLFAQKLKYIGWIIAASIWYLGPIRTYLVPNIKKSDHVRFSIYSASLVAHLRKTF